MGSAALGPMGEKTRLLSVGAGLIGLVAAVVVGIFGQEIVRRLMPSNKRVISQATLSQLASEMNRKLPMMADRDTEVTSTIGLEGMFVYNYRLLNQRAEDVDPSWLVQTVRPLIVNAACSTPGTRDTLLKFGVTMRYMYYDQNRRFIAMVDVTPKDCGF